MAQTADLPQLPATSQPGSQLAMNQQLAQLSGLGSTGLPMQSALPSIQPSVQGPIYGEEVKRKSLQPGLKNASKAMFDGSANASKAAYNKASNMVENMDKDSMKKVGKKVAAVAGALGGQALRQYVRQETGLTLPRIRPNQKPNQQAQVANAQLLEINKLNALKQQLEMKQKILQLQNQVALQQQQQQLQQAQNQVALQQQQQQLQQAQNQAAIQASASAVPMAAANMLGQAQPGVPQMAPGAQSNQGMAGPGVLHQPTPIMGGTNGIPPAIAGVSTPGPYNSNLNSMAPTPLNEPSNTLGVPGYNPSAITSSQANVASSVHSFDSNEMAPIPASEMQWATTHALNPNHMAPIPPSEANAASVHSFDSEMAPIPACELNSLPVNDSSMAPIPPARRAWHQFRRVNNLLQAIQIRMTLRTLHQIMSIPRIMRRVNIHSKQTHLQLTPSNIHIARIITAIITNLRWRTSQKVRLHSLLMQHPRRVIPLQCMTPHTLAKIITRQDINMIHKTLMVILTILMLILMPIPIPTPSRLTTVMDSIHMQTIKAIKVLNSRKFQPTTIHSHHLLLPLRAKVAINSSLHIL